MLFLFYSTAQSKRQDRKHNNNNMASNSALIHLNDVVCIMVGCVTLCVAFFGLFFAEL